MTGAASAKKHRQSRTPGTSPYEAAKKIGVAWPLLRNAIENGEVEMRTFGGRNFLTDAEIERVKKLLEEGML
jgi:hypothetical protein